MADITIHEFDCLVERAPGVKDGEGLGIVPNGAYRWLESACLRSSNDGQSQWLRLTQRAGRRAIQVTNHVGIIRSPGGFQIEVLPKIGRIGFGRAAQARQLLIEMLSSLPGFRHIRTDNAALLAARMPLLEVFVSEFLSSVERIVKRGLRSDYSLECSNLPVLRGKIVVTRNLRENLCRADRFFTEHDLFTPDRAENRLIHTALRRVLALTKSQSNQQLARELCFAFNDTPLSSQPYVDFRRTRLDRGMRRYAEPLAWAELILADESPLTGRGEHRAPSLLFPMDAVFEAYVARYLPRQLYPNFVLKTQKRNQHLVEHNGNAWFQLKPDLLICQGTKNRVVLDTKWKLLDALKSNGSEKYGLSQSDFYQLNAYGQTYLNGDGTVVLIYPATESFTTPLPVFEFRPSKSLRLWVVPFDLKRRRLLVPTDERFPSAFVACAAEPA